MPQDFRTIALAWTAIGLILASVAVGTTAAAATSQDASVALRCELHIYKTNPPQAEADCAEEQVLPCHVHVTKSNPPQVATDCSAG
jgi:hypothetical protein